MSDVCLKSFDYDALDYATRQLLQGKTGGIHGLMRRTADSIARTGEKLLAVKERLLDMEASAWQRAEFELFRFESLAWIAIYLAGARSSLQ